MCKCSQHHPVAICAINLGKDTFFLSNKFVIDVLIGQHFQIFSVDILIQFTNKSIYLPKYQYFGYTSKIHILSALRYSKISKFQTDDFLFFSKQRLCFAMQAGHLVQHPAFSVIPPASSSQSANDPRSKELYYASLRPMPSSFLLSCQCDLLNP